MFSYHRCAAGVLIAAVTLSSVTDGRADITDSSTSPVITQRTVSPPIITSGRLGFAAMDLDTSKIIGHNLDQRFPLQSTFKAVLGVKVLQTVDAGQLSLDQPVTVRRSDLSVGGVICADLSGDAKDYTVQQLLELAVGMSDNTAADVLMRKVGGPEAVMTVLKQAEVDDMRIDRYEREFQPELAGLRAFQPDEVIDLEKFETAIKDAPAQTQMPALESYIQSTDPRDSGTPRSAVQFLARLAHGDLLSTRSNVLLMKIMTESPTGAKRVKAGLPADASWAHKTGTGGDIAGRNTGTNDIGIVTLADGKRIALAVFLSGSAASPAEREAVCAEAAKRLLTQMGAH